MKERDGDIWKAIADYYVITTDGDVRKDGAAVMGRGVALQAKKRFSGIEYTLGRGIQLRGNHVKLIGRLITFPVKHHWRQKADLELIKRSANELRNLINDLNVRNMFALPLRIALPRPGCGNGGLDWKSVKSWIEIVLDDRFTVYQI